MRSVLLVGALGFAILGGGQTTAQGQRALQEIPIKATNSVESGNVLRFSGNVQISLGNYVVVADEVDVPLNGSGTLQLRGDVHLDTDPTVTRIVRQPFVPR
jgi:lipopolysaccharide export system protein LptA